MNGSDEVAITSESSGQLWNACIWNPRAGTSLMTYKGGGVASPHSLCLLGTDYLMMSDHAKPVLHAWQLNSQQPVSAQGIRLVCPARVSCMAITPSGTFCVTAIAEKLHVWLLCSGAHLAVAVRHYKPVTCIRFTDDGSHFVSAGEDGLVLVWPLSKLVSRNPGDIPANQVEPRYTFHDHVVPVSDVYVGPGRMRARMMTVSVDRTCKIYDLSTGVLILSLVFDCSLTAVTADSTELEVFVGGKNGTIYQFGLHSPPRMKEYYLTKEQHSKSFLGHTKAITSLSSSKDGSTLLSGSLDASVMLWHIPSRQCIRVLKHNGPVTNAFFAFIPKNVFLEERKPTQVLSSIQRNLDNDEKKMMCIVRTQKDVRPKKEYEEEFESYKYRPVIVRDRVEDSGLKDQIAELKKINHELFEFAKNNILQSSASNQEMLSKSEIENANDLPSSKTFQKGTKKIKKRKRAGQKSDYY